MYQKHENSNEHGEVPENAGEVACAACCTTCCFCFCCCGLLVTAIVVPILALHSDDLNASGQLPGICPYDVVPFTVMFLSAAGNTLLVFASFFTDDVISFFRRLCGRRIPPEGEFRPLSFFLQLFLLVVTATLFLYRLYRDLDFIHGAPGNTWDVYQCYGFVMFNSPNFRAAVFGYLASPFKQFVERDIVRHPLNQKMINIVFYWSWIVGILYTLAIFAPAYTHSFSGVFIFFPLWTPLVGIVTLAICCYLPFKATLDEKGRLLMNLPEAPRDSFHLQDLDDPAWICNKVICGSTFVIFFVVYVLIGTSVCTALNYEVMMRFYDGSSWHNSIFDSLKRGSLIDYVNSMEEKGLHQVGKWLLLIRSFV